MAPGGLCNFVYQLRTIVFVATLALPPAARAADPVLMYLLGFAGNLLETYMKEDKASPGLDWSSTRAKASAPTIFQSAKAPENMTQEDLRALIEESFAYLSREQRSELHAQFEKALSDPANSPHREAMVNEFVEVARKVQYTHSQLNKGATDDKRLIAERFAANSRNLPPDQLQSLLDRLMKRLLPNRTDLNDR